MIFIKFSDILDATDSHYEIVVTKFTLFCTVLIFAIPNKTVFTQARTPTHIRYRGREANVGYHFVF